MTSTMIAVDGGEVWADDSGGDGPPLVLLHPGVGDSRIWAPVLPALTGNYKVIRYDARGMGASADRVDQPVSFPSR
jgi:3-oxoadipate enol-lactonase